MPEYVELTPDEIAVYRWFHEGGQRTTFTDAMCVPECDADWHCKHGGCEGCDECDAYERDAIERGNYELRLEGE